MQTSLRSLLVVAALPWLVAGPVAGRVLEARCGGDAAAVEVPACCCCKRPGDGAALAAPGAHCDCSLESPVPLAAMPVGPAPGRVEDSGSSDPSPADGPSLAGAWRPVLLRPPALADPRRTTRFLARYPLFFSLRI